MANTLNKINIPASTLTQLPNIDNKTHEAQYINELIFKRDRTNVGNVIWTSETSGITYNTNDYESNLNIYNCGETGILNLLQLECANFLMDASDFKSLGEHYTILQNSIIAGNRYYKIAQIDINNDNSYYNQLSLLIGGTGVNQNSTRVYYFVDFSGDITGVDVNVTQFSTDTQTVFSSFVSNNEIFFGYNKNNSTNKIELWMYLMNDIESLGINVINNYEKNNTNVFEVGDLQQSLTSPTNFVKANSQYLIKNTDINNKNLLLNNNFYRPVNQRGQINYKINTANETIMTYDMWRLNSSLINTEITQSENITSINIPSGTISDTVIFYQPVKNENLRANQYYTIQFCVSDNTNIKNLYITNTNSNGNDTIINSTLYVEKDPLYNRKVIYGTFFIPPNTGINYLKIGLNFNVTNTQTSTNIYWAKLENGYFPTKYIYPNYEEELIKCQHYYYRLNNNFPSLLQPIGTGYSWTANQFTVLLRTPTPMRVNPTISFANLTIRVYNSSTQIAVTGQNNITYTTDGLCSVVFTVASGISVNTIGMLFLNMNSNNNGGYIEFNAEL